MLLNKLETGKLDKETVFIELITIEAKTKVPSILYREHNEIQADEHPDAVIVNIYESVTVDVGEIFYAKI